jgi:hypothetical protein
MIVAHSAPWSGKSGARDGAPQVAIGIPVAAGKMRAAESAPEYAIAPCNLGRS